MTPEERKSEIAMFTVAAGPKKHPVHSSGLVFGYAADRCTEPE